MEETIDLAHFVTEIAATSVATSYCLMLLDYAQLNKLSKQLFCLLFCGTTTKCVPAVALSDPPSQQMHAPNSLVACREESEIEDTWLE